MAFRYDNLWRVLEQRDMTKEELRVKIRSSPNTMVKLNNNEPVALDIVDRICDVLKCFPNDIVEYIPSEVPLHGTISYKKGDIFLCETVGNLKKVSDPNYSERAHIYLSCLIYQSELFIGAANSIIIIPFTRRVNHEQKPTEVIIVPDEFNKLECPHTLLVSGMSPLPKITLTKKCGSLSDADMQKVDKVCSVFLGL